LDDVPVEIRRRRGIALLAYLAVEQKSQSREVLATTFWPEYSRNEARTDLSRTLWYLKRDLGDGWLAVRRQTIGLHANATILVDVAVCLDLIRQCATHDHAASEICDRCLPLLNEVVDLHRDEFMAGFSLPDSSVFDDWQIYRATEQRRQLATTLSRLSQFHSSSGNTALAIDQAKRWLDLDPLHEPAHQQLMLLYARAEQSSDALRQYQACVRIFKDELDAVPGPELTRLYDEIRRGTFEGDHAEPRERQASMDWPPLSTPQSARNNLPAQTTPFVGRKDLLASLTGRLRTGETRLVTIVGPGGIGKTRMAIEIGAAFLDTELQSTCFVALAPLRAAEDIAPAIAEAMALQLQANQNQTKQQLLDYFKKSQDGKRLMLILDNYEHLLAGAALVSDILEANLDVRILVTSRERLHLSGETVVRLEGLGYPPLSWGSAHNNMAEILGHDAVQLFLQSAQRVRADFKLAYNDLPNLARLCDLVQGMPLGILLAASWIESLTIEEIVIELGQSLDFLESELRDLPERQRSMRAIFEHSWQILDQEQRNIFMALSVFRGGSTREAAREIAGASVRDLANLVSKSLVKRDADGRYQVHELLRQFAEERLRDSDREDKVLAGHGRYFTDFLWEREADLKGHRQAAALQEIDIDFENVRAAWHWAVQRQQVELLDRALEALYWFCVMRSRLPSGTELLRLAVEGITPVDEPSMSRTRGRLLSRAMKGTAGLIGDPDYLRRNVEGALAIARDADDQAEIAYSLWSFGLILMRANEYAQAVETLERSLALFQMLEDRFYQAEVLGDIGRCLRIQTNQSGREYLQESLNLKREIGNEIGVAVSLHELGWQHYMLGELIEAERDWQDAYSFQARAGNRQAVAENLTGLCRMALDRGDMDQVTQLANEILSISAKIANIRHQAIPHLYLGAVSNAQQAYSEARKHFERSLEITYDSDLRILAELGLAYAASGLDESQRSACHLLRTLRIGGGLTSSFFGSILLLQAALLYTRTGQPERAARLYALAFNSSSVSNTYNGRLPLIISLRSELEATLSPAQFERAWRDGEELEMVETLLEVRSLQGTKTRFRAEVGHGWRRALAMDHLDPGRALPHPLPAVDLCGSGSKRTTAPRPAHPGRAGCDRYGDAIQYLREQEGLGFAQACTALGFAGVSIIGSKWLSRTLWMLLANYCCIQKSGFSVL
jgi:predicted ATPase/DNA-binding SARP family transcriptional activator